MVKCLMINWSHFARLLCGILFGVALLYQKNASKAVWRWPKYAVGYVTEKIPCSFKNFLKKDNLGQFEIFKSGFCCWRVPLSAAFRKLRKHSERFGKVPKHSEDGTILAFR